MANLVGVNLIFKKDCILLLWIVYVIFLFPFFSKFAVVNDISFFDYIEEVFVILLLPYSIRGAAKVWRENVWAKATIVLFILYIVAGLLGNLSTNVSLLAGGLQIFLGSKLILAFFAFLGAYDGDWLIKRILFLFKILLVFSFLHLVFQFIFPKQYDLLFDALHQRALFTIPGISDQIPRAVGAFQVAGDLSYFSAMYLAYAFSQKYIEKRKVGGLWVVLSVILLIATFSRQEIASFVVIVSLLYLVYKKQVFVGQKLLVVSSFMGVILVVTFASISSIGSYFSYVSTSMKLDDVEASRAARVVFYVKGIEIANDNFPLGVGHGGFGGAAARIFDSPVYAQYGVTDYSFYQENGALTDTFWPHVIAESGWLGFLLYLFYLGCLLMFVKNIRSTNSTEVFRVVTLAGITYLIMNSPTSASMLSSFAQIMCLCFVTGLSTKRRTRN
ncbi:MAG: O-antigen ligase family protein [Gammaproteobacteria bacterium]|nr:O-antigen ligase family protein [Gammaproteobacteria bacterium]